MVIVLLPRVFSLYFLRFYVPYPGHNGLPTVSVSGLVAMIAAVFAGIAESIGDYHACANIVDAPPPPPHVVARWVNEMVYEDNQGTSISIMQRNHYRRAWMRLGWCDVR